MALAIDAPYQDITRRVIGAAMAVHNDLGPGHRELVYQRALALQMAQVDLRFRQEEPVPVKTGQGDTLVVYRVDFLVEGKVVVETKAFSHSLENTEIAQAIGYLVAAKCPVALLINFGRRRLEFRRIFPPKQASKREQRMQG